MTNPTPPGQVPEALQPDTALLVARNCRETGSDPSCPFFARVQLMDAAYVLERLHAENQTLQSGYDAARLEIEALHARVQELERERAVAAEREACAKLVQDMSHHRRWVRAGINGEPIRPCEYAAAIRARGAQGESNG